MPSLSSAALLATTLFLFSVSANAQTNTATPGVIPQWYPNRYCMPHATREEFGNGPAEGEQWGQKWNPLVAALLNSPYPCEQVMGLQSICSANGTAEADFIAEKQCFCGGNYWEAAVGCDKCWRANGLVQEGLSAEMVEEGLNEVKEKFCNASPHAGRPLSQLRTVLSGTAVPSMTVVSSAISSYQNTEVFYWTGEPTAVAGKYSGEAEERQKTFTQVPPYTEVYTPTFTPEGLLATTGTTTSAASSGAAQATGTDGTSAAAAAAATTTEATGGAGQLKAAGGVVMALVGAMVAL